MLLLHGVGVVCECVGCMRLPTHSPAHVTFECNIKREDEHKCHKLPHFACHKLKDIIGRDVVQRVGGNTTVHFATDETPRDRSSAVAYPQPPGSCHGHCHNQWHCCGKEEVQGEELAGEIQAHLSDAQEEVEGEDGRPPKRTHHGRGCDEALHLTQTRER